MDGLYQENWVFFGMVADNTSSEMTSWDPRPSSRWLRILISFSYKSSRDLAPPSRGLRIIGPTPHTPSHSRPIHIYQLFDFLLISLIHPIKVWIFHGSMPHPSLISTNYCPWFVYDQGVSESKLLLRQNRRAHIFDAQLHTIEQYLQYLPHIILIIWKKTIISVNWSSFSWKQNVLISQKCERGCTENGLASYREADPFQNGWIFGKVPKGEGGEGHFQSKNLCCRFLPL